MDFFIRILDGQPYGHPIVGDNFREAFPDIDPANLPPEFASFIRIDPDSIQFLMGFYEVLVEEYVWDGLVVRDNWHMRPMTEEEHEVCKQEGIKVAELRRSSMLEYAKMEKAQAITIEDISVWDVYIDTLIAYTYDDPWKADMPRPPRRLANGILFSLNSSGTAPNVIG